MDENKLKKSLLAKKMMIFAKNYYDASIIINNNYPRVNLSTIYPLLFLQRHTLELIIKSLIIQENYFDEIELSKLKVKLSYNKNNTRKLNETHVLVNLYKMYYNLMRDKINEGFSLLSIPSLDHKYILNLLSEYEIHDSNSDKFRYPVSKDGKLNKVSTASNKESLEYFDITPEIKPYSKLYVKTDFLNHFKSIIKPKSIYDNKSFDFIDKLFELIRKLIDYSNYRRLFSDLS